MINQQTINQKRKNKTIKIINDFNDFVNYRGNCEVEKR